MQHFSRRLSLGLLSHLLLVGVFGLFRAAAFAQPSPPAAVAVSPSAASGEVTITWAAVPGATGYTIRRAPALTGPFTTLATNHPSPTYTDATSTSGIFAAPGQYTLRLSATNAHGESSRLLTVTVLPQRATWRQTHFGTTADTGNAADLADPDADGMVNLLEYAFGMDPLAPGNAGLPPGSVSLPTLQLSGLSPQPSLLQLTFLRARPELTYHIEASSTLAPDSWTIIATNPGTVSLTTPVTVTDPAPVSENPRRFLRLRVIAP